MCQIVTQDIILSVKQLTVQCYDEYIDCFCCLIIKSLLISTRSQYKSNNLLSQHFRNQKRNSKPNKSSECEGRVKPKPCKKARLVSPARNDDLSQRRNLELLSSTEEGFLSCKTFSNLVMETYPTRRRFFKEEAKSSKEILNMSIPWKIISHKFSLWMFIQLESVSKNI